MTKSFIQFEMKLENMEIKQIQMIINYNRISLISLARIKEKSVLCDVQHVFQQVKKRSPSQVCSTVQTYGTRTHKRRYMFIRFIFHLGFNVQSTHSRPFQACYKGLMSVSVPLFEQQSRSWVTVD